jgi:GTP-binding protein
MSAIVAIVGRPNVGKSALFNRMIRAGSGASSAAITEKTPGVTRDRNYGKTEWEGKGFSVIDTGGFYAEGLPHEHEEIADQVKEQALYAIEDADLLIHLLDGKEGLMPADEELVSILRKSGKNILWVVNKIDTMIKESKALEFYSIGADEIIPVSAMTGLGFDDFMDKVIENLPQGRLTEGMSRELEALPRIAVVGRPNVGKSTLINSLLGKRRLIVSPVPGTTRDAVDSVCAWHGEKYLFVDTAGMRKKVRGYSSRAPRNLAAGSGSPQDSIESFSIVGAMKSIERADVVIMVLDATQDIGEQDQRIAGMVEEQGKAGIFLINKWDLVKDPDEAYKKITEELSRKMWFMEYAPHLTASGLEKKRIAKIFPMVNEVLAERKHRISTGILNRFLGKLLEKRPFPKYRGREVKFLYMTQFGVEPPSFSIFVNYPQAVNEQHLRYLEKMMREKYSFKGTPIRIYVKSR